jgi:predicted RNA-binding protein with PUA-like domain
MKTAYPDATVEPDEKGGWICVDLKAGAAFSRPVTLEEIKTIPALKNMALLRQSRLSVQPVGADEAAKLLQLGGL